MRRPASPVDVGRRRSATVCAAERDNATPLTGTGRSVPAGVEHLAPEVLLTGHPDRSHWPWRSVGHVCRWSSCQDATTCGTRLRPGQSSRSTRRSSLPSASRELVRKATTPAFRGAQAFLTRPAGRPRSVAASVQTTTAPPLAHSGRDADHRRLGDGRCAMSTSSISRARCSPPAHDHVVQAAVDVEEAVLVEPAASRCGTSRLGQRALATYSPALLAAHPDLAFSPRQGRSSMSRTSPRGRQGRPPSPAAPDAGRHWRRPPVLVGVSMAMVELVSSP